MEENLGAVRLPAAAKPPPLPVPGEGRCRDARCTWSPIKTGPTALHVGGWRHPESTLDDILEPGRYEHIARVLEAAKFDAHVRRGGRISFLDPAVVLPVMAAATRHLGLGATFHQLPYRLPFGPPVRLLGRHEQGPGRLKRGHPGHRPGSTERRAG